jgi:hypothetical protein
MKKTTKTRTQPKRAAVKDLTARKSSSVKGGIDPINGSKLPRTTRPVDPING